MSAEHAAPARVSDQDAIKALARVVNVGGDATAQQTLQTYLTQDDAVTAEQDDDGQGDDGGESKPTTRAERRAQQGA